MKLSAAVFNEAEISVIHDHALTLLERYGIRLQHEKARRIFAAHGAKIDQERVFLPKSLAQHALQDVKASFLLEARNPEHSRQIGRGFPSVYGPATGMVYVSDVEQGRRPACSQDLQNFLKLTQTSPHVQLAVAGLVYPTDLDPYRGLYQQMMQAIELSDKPLFGLTQDETVAADAIAMARIATEDRYEHFIIGVVNSLSPFAWDQKMLGALMVFAENHQPCIMTPCSLAGLSSHVRLYETVLQNHAEILAGIILAQLIHPGTPVVYGNTSSITDMRSMNLSLGAPEYALILTASVQLARFLGVPCRSGGGLSDAKTLDAQAGLEAAMNLLFTEINQVDVVLQGMGVMESFASISYEKWIMDEEIRERILRIRRGIQIPDRVELDEIGQMGKNDSFIGHRSTLDYFRSEFYRPLISDRNAYDTWQARKFSFETTATAAWKKRLDEYEQPAMPPEIRRRLTQFVQQVYARLDGQKHSA